MDETSEIRSLGEGRYSFQMGRQFYTLATKLDEKRFFRVVENARSFLEGLPSNLSQDEILFLGLMAQSYQMEELSTRIEGIIAELGKKTEEGGNEE